MVRKRAAFTLIELVFAIVVISITVLSLPMMIRVTDKAIQNNIAQEAIFAASTELNEVLTQHWDANSIDPNDIYAYTKVIDIEKKCNNDPNSSRYRLMPGHINQPLHRRCLSSDSTTAAFSSSSTVETVENKKHDYRLIFLNPAPDKNGYKDKYKSRITITKNAKFGTKKDINIKKITVTITDSKRHVLTSLKTYVSNIGEIDYYKKVY